MKALHKLEGCAMLALLAFSHPIAAQKSSDPSAAQSNAAMKERFAPPSPVASWAPPDVDAAPPPLDSSAQCELPKVLKGAGDRVQELVSSLPKFAATERMQHYEADASGKWRTPQTVAFEYEVEMKQPRAGMLVMEETRDRGTSLMKFPARIATLGLPALAMVFHPLFAGEYEMKCEGMGNWDGYYAWVVHFQQRADKLPRLRSYRIKDLVYPIKLKGRAWISSDNFQVLHIDTDLLEPVPQILLFREHVSVDYRPVHFVRQNEDLWLQQSAEVFMDFRAHRYRRVHQFTDFLLFSVDTSEQVKAPKEQ